MSLTPRMLQQRAGGARRPSAGPRWQEFEAFRRGMNQVDARTAIADDEAYWLENMIPIGAGALQILNGPGDAVATISVGIASLWGFTLNGAPVHIAINRDGPLTQEELTAIARRLNGRLAGGSAPQIREMRLELAPVEGQVVDAVAGLLEGTNEVAGLEPSFLEGVRELLRQPEFTQGERILGLLELLEDRNISRAIPVPPGSGPSVTITIGGEHPVDVMRLGSVISARYSGPSGLRGMLSVVGPTRMHYPRSVAMVRYMSSLMEELLGDYFA